MDCFTARRTLAAIRADSDDWHDSAFAQAATHLRHCPECQAACEAEQDFDREFARACLDIRMPQGLHDRLLVALALGDRLSATPDESNAFTHSGAERTSAEPQPTHPVLPAGSIVAARSARSFSRRRAAFALVAAACVLIAASFGLALRSTFPKSSVDQVLDSVTKVELDSGTELAGDAARLPTLIYCPESLQSAPVRSFKVDPRQPPGSVRFFRIEAGPRRLQALLVLLDRRCLNAAEWAALGSTFSKAPTIYKNGDAARVWKEGSRVYVCVIKKHGAEGFDLLAPRQNQA